jgi:dUTP pyrophosphatase
MNKIALPIQRLPHAEGLSLPSYGTEGAAGMDLVAAVTNDLVIEPGKRVLVPTGLCIALPEGYEAQVRARSGLAAKNGLCVLNGPGTIDADYRGEIKIILANLGEENFTITRGMRVAQMVVAPYTRATLYEMAELPESQRGAGGFGSTGTG